MSQVLAQLTGSPYDGEDFNDDWHGVVSTDTSRTVCGHALDASGSFEWEERVVKRGGITCKDCMDYILDIKGIRL